MEALARRQSTAVGPPLKTIEVKVRKEIKLGDKAGYVHYRRAGEWLIKAETRFDSHDDFILWGESKFGRSEATLGKYMLYAQRVTKDSRATLSEVIEPNRDRGHKPDWHRPVQDIMAGVNPKAMAKEAKDAKKEKQLVQALGYQLINIGFKALATKLHPDKSGGSKEAMARLNQVRQILRGAL